MSLSSFPKLKPRQNYKFWTEFSTIKAHILDWILLGKFKIESKIEMLDDVYIKLNRFLKHLSNFEQSNWCVQFPIQILRNNCHWKSYTSAPCVCAVVHVATAGSRTDADADDS